jgi:IS5 family transposase
LKTRVGRVYRDVQRQLAAQPLEATQAFAELLGKTERLLTQTRHSNNKLYSVHAPEVECLGEDKAHKLYEFGVKASFVVTHKEELVVGALSCPDNPYGGTPWNRSYTR